MFFAQPFILASEFIQHVMLLVLCGLVAVEYCARLGQRDIMRKERAAFGTIGVIVLLTTVWIIVEYFVPVKIMQFQLLVHVPVVLTVIVFMYRIDMRTLPRYFAHYRAMLTCLFIAHFAIDAAQILLMYREPKLLRSIIKTVEVFALYGFVIHYARHLVMHSPVASYVTSTVPSFFTVTNMVRTASVVLLLFAFTPHANAFSLTTRIGDQSTELKAGDRLYFDVEIKWPENDRRQDLRVEYQIVDQGQVIASEKVLRAVETQASFLDYLVVPANAPTGMKELRVILETYDKSLSQSISATFTVAKSDNKMLVYFIVLASAIALVVLLVIFQIVMISRTQRLLAQQKT